MMECKHENLWYCECCGEIICFGCGEIWIKLVKIEIPEVFYEIGKERYGV